MTKTSIALHAIIFIILVPFLEISDTHLLNPDWPAHARLHEAWQLLTNASLSALALLLVWRWNRPITALVVCLTVTVPFLAAWAIQSIFGGSMKHSDGTEIAVFGMNAGVLIVLLITAALLASLATRTEVPHDL
tara:strand:- start:3192 stop:3593 length:402 start_codon:yes stop_codon:yes gene_type:complete